MELCLTFWRTTILCSMVATPFYIPTTLSAGSNSCTPSPTLVTTSHWRKFWPS